ncbi:hypothetical protein [Sphingomonas sp. Leaf21]|jgi:hypothetical protein|uniref:hypothetical protein n=1 Tax=Sphingomonas sp. Leaf21 TaxID=2876550 RepID=UPI001E28D184|nr:hypothetical protein [Sphingomonas sp. Leaf21]
MANPYDPMAWLAFWTAPARFAMMASEAMLSAQSVIATRMGAMANGTSSAAEMTLMVSEKVKAFDQSAKLWNRDSAALSKLSHHDPRGGILDAWETMARAMLIGASMPVQAMTPVHKAVTANQKRLAKR